MEPVGQAAVEEVVRIQACFEEVELEFVEGGLLEVEQAVEEVAAGIAAGIDRLVERS